ncbi:hypothetical protein J6590_031302 [Homalodisca vitripennis]|nr:hypothetical protein J6590_031302 [Homalodisca vitripennis]
MREREREKGREGEREKGREGERDLLARQVRDPAPGGAKSLHYHMFQHRADTAAGTRALQACSNTPGLTNFPNLSTQGTICPH